MAAVNIIFNYSCAACYRFLSMLLHVPLCSLTLTPCGASGICKLTPTLLAQHSHLALFQFGWCLHSVAHALFDSIGDYAQIWSLLGHSSTINQDPDLKIISSILAEEGSNNMAKKTWNCSKRNKSKKIGMPNRRIPGPCKRTWPISKTSKLQTMWKILERRRQIIMQQ